MNDFWVGTIAGAVAALILFICSAAVVNARVNELQTQMNQLQQTQAAQQEWIEENEYIMRTYKFFNESWQAILDKERRTRHENKFDTGARKEK